MGSLFGTDGVRGIANVELTGELAFALGRAGAHIFTAEIEHPRILIGCDTRISCDMLECALCAGILSSGANAFSAGVMPTPGIAYLVREMKFDAGVVISASHNPVAYNGIKFFDGSGEKLSDEREDKIEALMKEGGIPRTRNVGRRMTLNGADAMYADFLFRQAPKAFSNLKIVCDCANGASAHIAPTLFRRLGCQIIPINHNPNGLNINVHCGSTHPEAMQEAVREQGADVGFAFDGDADRLIACDERGNLIDGDVIIGLLAIAMNDKGTLKRNTVVVTQMSNLGLELTLRDKGIRVVKTQVGDRYVFEEMARGGYNLGGEQSGHVLLLDLSKSGDGMQTAIALLNLIKDTGKRLSELAAGIRILPQVLVNAKVNAEKKKGFMEIEEIAKAVEKLSMAYRDSGRVLIRASGTEHIIRIMIEGPDADKMWCEAEELKSLIESHIGEGTL
jgi:phosphoglucosamine mutase